MTEPAAADDAQDAPGSRLPANMTIIAPGEHGPRIETNTNSGSFFGRRILPRRLTRGGALFVLAALCGAVGGAAASTAIGLFLSPPASPSTETAAVRDAIARIDADLATLKSSFDKAGKARTAQFGKVGERIEKLEKSQEDASSKLSKLSENLDKTRNAMNAQTASAKPAPDVTGSIPTPVPRPEAKGSQIVHDWVLNRVTRGGALVESDRGLFEVYPGDPLPGLGRVEAVRYQNGRWVVVTQRGLIVRP